MTPDNLDAERAALEHDYARGDRREPRFSYTAIPNGVGAPLEEAARLLDRRGPLGQVYADRARELSLEARLCACTGEETFWDLARQRYPASVGDEAADELAREWLAATVDGSDDRRIVSDSEHPDSLLSRMRVVVGTKRLPIRVVVRDNMSALAATGAQAIYIASGQLLSDRDVERTVLHEIYGHTLPRHRAMKERLGIFRVGTARGSDHQEGWALRLECRHGFLRGARARELALRHIAARSVERRVSFSTTVELLEREGLPLKAALRIAARVWRGGGLAREVSYIRSMVEVDDALQRWPSLEAVFERGRVAVAPALVIGNNDGNAVSYSLLRSPGDSLSGSRAPRGSVAS
ncbi:DUF1704 domain-containing protein [Desulfobulbus sp. AH-315-M07]|nr:DUF1704 domain-containing protein [Desulfobulbus sp. AH-315-M07]